MKHILFTLIIGFAFLIVTAQEQSLTIDASQRVSTFSFNNSRGVNQDADYQSILTGSYSVGYRSIFESNIILRAGVGKRNGGANYVYDEMNYSWRLEYADANLGIGYRFILGKVNPYIVAGGYYGYLVRGIQVLNNEELNITVSEVLQSDDYGIIGDIGVSFKITDIVSAYIEGEYMQGLYNIEKESGQEAVNWSYALKLGLSFNISAKDNSTKRD